MEHLRRVWLATRERLPFRTPGSVPILGLASAPIVETKFLELAMSLLDFSHRIPLGTFSILHHTRFISFYLENKGGLTFYVNYLSTFSVDTPAGSSPRDAMNCWCVPVAGDGDGESRRRAAVVRTGGLLGLRGEPAVAADTLWQLTLQEHRRRMASTPKLPLTVQKWLRLQKPFRTPHQL